MNPFKKNNRFFNHNKERVRHKIFNVAQVAWHIFVRSMLAKRKPFVPKGSPILDWVEKPLPTALDSSPSVTWLGHASCLITIAGISVLTDPIDGGIGNLMQRALPAPLPFGKLPHVDVIIISHNHRDHLDVVTLRSLAHFNPIVLVPAGDKALVSSLGFHRVSELHWHEAMPIEVNRDSKAKITFTFLPAKHWSGRGVLDINKSLWGSWLMQTQEHSFYFAGDSAYDTHFSQIAHTYGPPDVVLMPIGPEEPRNLMAHSHVGVEEALNAFDDLNATHFLPIHWGTFPLGNDHYDDPINKLKNLWFQKARLNKKLHLVPAGRTIFLGEV